jgi:hypothetical protein
LSLPGDDTKICPGNNVSNMEINYVQARIIVFRAIVLETPGNIPGHTGNTPWKIIYSGLKITYFKV